MSDLPPLSNPDELVVDEDDDELINEDDALEIIEDDGEGDDFPMDEDDMDAEEAEDMGPVEDNSDVQAGASELVPPVILQS